MAGLMLGNRKHKLKSSEAILAGGCSGITTRAVVSPFDVIKIRFQLHVAPISKTGSGGFYKGVVDAVRTVFRDEGIKAFWKGHTSSQMLSIVYLSTQFGAFEKISSLAWQLLPSEYQTSSRKPAVSFLCGGVSGMCASFVSQPFDTVRTRMVIQRKPLMYKNTFDAIGKIFKADGPGGFYRGLVPNLLQVMPYAGLQFGAYSSCVLLYRWLSPERSDERLSNFESFIFGATSGLSAKLFVLPLDMSKKRLQVQGFKGVNTRGGWYQIPHYTGVIHCFSTIYKLEGVVGFYKGGVPSLLKAFVSTGMTFMSYNFFAGLILASKESSSITKPY